MTRTSHAIVPVSPQKQSYSAAVGQRPLSSFLAHVIATANQAPQTRSRRRAEPEVAVAAYSGTAPRTVMGHTLNRGA